MSMQRLSSLTVVFGGVLALHLAVSTSPSAAAEGATCEEEPTDQRIRYGDLINCAIDQIGDSDTFRFSGGSGETVKVQISRLGGGQGCFQLFDPDGRSPDVPRCANSAMNYLLNQTGPHSLVITERFLDETASYALALERIDPPSPAVLPLDYNEVINGEIDGIGDVDMFSMTGEAGDTIRVQISRLNGGSGCFQLFASDGTSLDVPRCTNSAMDYTLSQSGTHAIAVTERFQDEVAQYALTLVCVAGVCPDADLPAVSGCIARRGSPFVSRRVRLLQSDEPTQTTLTDVRGCYEFSRVAGGKRFQVRIVSPRRRQ
jgi:hypothetical protein